MKIMNFTILFLGIAMSSFSQNIGEIALLNVSKNAISQLKDEEAAIRTVCEKETKSWNNRDADGMIACHANKPYSLMLVAESGNVHYTKAKSELENELGMRELVNKMGEPSGDNFLNYGYVIHISGTSAFVHYDQKVKSKMGFETNFHEVRNLEKIDGKWKIIYVGAVEFKPESK
jgi:hypothetical protein